MKKLFTLLLCIAAITAGGCRKPATPAPAPADDQAVEQPAESPGTKPAQPAEPTEPVEPKPVTETEPKPTGLSAYKVAVARKSIAGVFEDVSGITYSKETKTLFAVRNKNCIVIEMDLEGNMKRKIGLTGFDDTEGIAWIGGNRFAVVEERRRKIVVVEIGPDTVEVRYENSKKYPVANPGRNDGLEGIAYDSVKKRFFVVKEKTPRKIYEIVLPADPAARAAISEPWDLQANSMGMLDAAGTYYDSRTGHLLIVSDESKCLVECTTSGKEVSRVRLGPGRIGLGHEIGPPEGVTLDDFGNIYGVGEPNVFYSFTTLGN